MQRAPRQSKCSKEETDKDLYPWSYEIEQKRQVTEKEILESTTNLFKACMKENKRKP